MLEHLLDQQGMRLVAHLEHVLRLDEAEALVGGLEVVEGLMRGINIYLL